MTTLVSTAINSLKFQYEIWIFFFLASCRWLRMKSIILSINRYAIERFFHYRFSASCSYSIKTLSLGWKEVEDSCDSTTWPRQTTERYSLGWVRGTGEMRRCLRYSNSAAVWTFSLQFMTISSKERIIIYPPIVANVPVTFPPPDKSKLQLAARIFD